MTTRLTCAIACTRDAVCSFLVGKMGTKRQNLSKRADTLLRVIFCGI